MVQPAGSASVNLLGDIPEAGTPVRIRLRGAALDYILEHPEDWSVRSADLEVPASLQLPEPGQNRSVTELRIIEPGLPQNTDRVIILDRGEQAADFTQLSIEFNSTGVLTTVLPSAGPTRDSFPQVGSEQVVLQRVSSDGVLRLAEINFSPSSINRYIRLLIRNGADHAVSRVTCLSEQQLPPLHEVPVALGTLHSLPNGRGSMWPLLLSSNRLPLQKLKIVSDAPGELRRIRLVRIDENLHELSQEAEMVFGEAISANGISRTENYMLLPGSMASDPLALITEDGIGNVLPLQSVKAYCAEVYISFNWPAAGDPLLSSIATSQPVSARPEPAALLAGEFSAVSEQPIVATVPDEKAPRRRSDLTGLNLQRFIPKIDLGYTAFWPMAAVLLLAGLSLLLAARLRDLRE